MAPGLSPWTLPIADCEWRHAALDKCLLWCALEKAAHAVPSPWEMCAICGVGWSFASAKAKLGWLLSAVENAADGSAESVIWGIERYAAEYFISEEGKRLDVLAGAKSLVLQAALQSSRAAHEALLEIGTFVGTSAIQLGLRVSDAMDTSRLAVSLELDPVYAAVARRNLSLARVSVEVWTGHSRDIAPRIVDELGEKSLGFMFFDHRGLTPGQDLHLMEKLGLIAGSARVVLGALRPQSVALINRLALAPVLPHVWALSDALMPEVEDFMLVVDADPLPAPAFPDSEHGCNERGGRQVGLAALVQSWRPGLDPDPASAAARRAEGFEATRAHVRAHLTKVGLEAQPWAFDREEYETWLWWQATDEEDHDSVCHPCEEEEDFQDDAAQEEGVEDDATSEAGAVDG